MKQKLSLEHQQLVADNHNLIYSFADKHKLDLEEYYGILALALCKAAQSYDPNKGKFSTISYTCMANAVKNHIRLKKKNKITLIYLDADYTDNDSDENLSNVITSDNLQPDIKVEGEQISQILLSMLSDKEKQIVIDRMNGLSEEQIATKMGCTHQNVHAFIKKIRIKWNVFYSKVATAIC